MHFSFPYLDICKHSLHSYFFVFFVFRQEERKNAMLQLIKMTREGTLGVWDEHFKTILLLLLETLGDNDVSQILANFTLQDCSLPLSE